MTHAAAHPLAGKTVHLNNRVATDHAQGQVVPGAKYRIEDWFDRLGCGSWMFAEGHPAALHYAMRTVGDTPIDDEVVYGKIGSLGHCVHVSELGDAV